MSQRKIQRSLARPVWNPVKKSFYRGRSTYVGPKRQPDKHYTALRTRLGSNRHTRFSLSLGTDDWYQRAPEQLGFALKPDATTGGLFGEFTKLLRKPDNDNPYYVKSGARKPDFYRQHTKCYLYDFTEPNHLMAFREVLEYLTTWVQKGDGRPLARGEVRELHRWPLTGLSQTCGTKGCSIPIKGYELLELVCEAAYMPRRPALEEDGTGDRSWGRSAPIQAWMDQVRITPTRTVFRLRRVAEDGTPAYYFEDCYDLKLTLYAAKRFIEHLPNWWEKVLRIWTGRKDDQDPDHIFRTAYQRGLIVEPDTLSDTLRIERWHIFGDRRRRSYRHTGPLPTQLGRRHKLSNQQQQTKPKVTISGENGTKEELGLLTDLQRLRLLGVEEERFGIIPHWRYQIQHTRYTLAPLLKGTARGRLQLVPIDKLQRYLPPERMRKICRPQPTTPKQPTTKSQTELQMELLTQIRAWRPPKNVAATLARQIKLCLLNAQQEATQLTYSSLEALYKHCSYVIKKNYSSPPSRASPFS